jgi:hypothetical protein
MTKEQIITQLEGSGFSDTGKLGWSTKRGDRPVRLIQALTAQRRCSFYAGENHLSATAHFKEFFAKITPTCEDHKGGPIWEGQSLPEVLLLIEKTYGGHVD